MTRALRKIIKWFYLLLAIALVLLAVMVQSGRSFSHLVGGYNQTIADYLSRSLNARVDIGQISATWDGLKPSLDIRDLRINSNSGVPIVALQQARLRLDMPESLLNRRLVWSHLGISQMQLEFLQGPEGHWRLTGLPSAEPDQTKATVQLDALIDMLLLSTRIEFKSSHLNFRFANGEQLSLDSPSVLMENRGDFHRLSLQVDVDKQPRSVYLVLESQGDPRLESEFHSSGYLQLNRFPTSEPIAAASAFLLGGTNRVALKSQGTVDANIWFESRPEGDGFDLTGRLGLQRLALPMSQRQLALDGFSSELSGYWLRSGAWRMALQNTQAGLGEEQISGVNLAVGAGGLKQPLQMSMAELDLGRLLHLLDKAGTLGSARLQEVLLTLNPRGKLKNLQLELPLANPKDWRLRANGEQLQVDAWRGVPALTGVDGYLEAGQKGGFINIDSHTNFSMFFSPTYAAPMAFASARGQVAWHLLPEQNQVYVNSGALEFTQGAEQLKGYMWLAIPWERNSGDIDLYLDIGAHNLNASLYQKYTPALIPESLQEWLARSVGSQNPGTATTAGLVYRGTLNSKVHAMRSHQLYLDLDNAALDYQAGWPALSQLKGRLLVDDAQVYAAIDSGKLYDSQLSATHLNVLPRSSGKGSVLKLEGRVQGSASDGLAVLRQGAMRQILGDSLDSWAMQGNIDTRLDLAIPLGTREPNLGYQNVDVDLTAEQLAMTNINLTFEQLKGQLRYRSTSGLASDKLNATLFGQPVSGQIATQKLTAAPFFAQTLVTLKGAVDAAALARWSQRPEVMFLQGLIPYNAQVALRHTAAVAAGASTEPPASLDAGEFARLAKVEVKVNSSLADVAVDLPAPYGKKPATKRPLDFTLSLKDDEAQVAVSYGKYLDALLRMARTTEKTLHNVNIALESKASLPAEPSFLISGNMREFDLDIWQRELGRYQAFGQSLAASEATSAATGAVDNPSQLAGLPFKAQLKLGHYDLGALRLQDLQVGVQRNAVAWQLQLENAQLAGNLDIPYSSFSPMQLRLQRLALETASLGMAPAAAPQAAASPGTSAAPIRQVELVDPRKLPLANIDIAALSLDGDNFGSWSLQLRPNKKGVVFDNIRGSIRGLRISGAKDDLDGAKLIWQQTEQGVKSRFIGTLAAGDVGAVLRQWDKPDTLESKAASFKADVYWLGSPQDFALTNLNGNMTLWLEQGRFKRDAGAGDGILRLMAILNFDSLARRMRLDFSDLYQSGLAYDEINGKVRFNEGVMVFEEPLVVRTPSSGLQMAGSVNLRKETIDARLVATLPVAGNLTFFTALATGLPAAAGIYLVSKLFKKQVDQATSLTYSIKGNWDDPTMRFDRLFESEKSLRDSVNKTEEEKAKEKEKKRKRSTDKAMRAKPTPQVTELPQSESQPD